MKHFVSWLWGGYTNLYVLKLTTAHQVNFLIIYKMFEDSIKHLKESGALYIVIKKSLGAPSAIKKLQSIYKHVEVLNKDKGYFIIKSFN